MKDAQRAASFGVRLKRGAQKQRDSLKGLRLEKDLPYGEKESVLLKAFGVVSGIGNCCTVALSVALGSSVWIALGVAGVLASGLMLHRSAVLTKWTKRYYKYKEALEDGRGLNELAMLVEKSPTFVRKELKEMAKLGMFSADEVVELSTVSIPLTEEVPVAEDKDLARIGQRYLKQIRKANDAIPGVEISAKLSKLEEVTGKIFEYVAAHPAQVVEARKYLDYYMPTVMKLVQTYKRFNSQGAKGSAVTQTKSEIEKLLSEVNDAFETLYDGMFQEDALDASSDIAVLRIMLKQDGLARPDFKEEQDYGISNNEEE